MGLADTDRYFRNMCRVILKEEIGSFEDYKHFLSYYTDPIRRAKSAISGKEVYYSESYCKEARFISLDEIELAKNGPLKEDELKDIDNLLNAVQERFHYAGNKILGNSGDIEHSENCSDCFHIRGSRELFNCEYVASSQMVLDSKYLAGCAWGSESSFCIRATEFYRVNRAFETTMTVFSNDAYFTYNCKNCNEVMFCFNQFSKRYCIGNRELPKDRYLALKDKLLAEIRDGLKKNKTFPSLVEFVSKGA